MADELFDPTLSEPPGGEPPGGGPSLRSLEAGAVAGEKTFPWWGALIPGFPQGWFQAAQAKRLRDLDDRTEAVQGMHSLRQIMETPKNLRGPLLDFWSQRFSQRYNVNPETLRDVLSKADDEQAQFIGEAITSLGGQIAAGEMDPRRLLEIAGDPIKAVNLGLSLAKARRAQAVETETAKIFGAPEPEEPTARPVVGQPAPAAPTPEQEQGVLERRLETWRQRANQLAALGAPEAALTVARQQIEALERRVGRAAQAAEPITEIGKLTRDRTLLLRQGMAAGSPAIQAIDRKLARGGQETAESAIGKAGDDLARADRLYGRESVQYQAILQSLKTGGEAPKLSDANSLRSQFTGLSKDFITVRDSFERLREAAAAPSAAGDLAMIFNFMKMLDPGSVVREAEFANAQNAAGVPDQVRNLWNRALSGERLNPRQREDFVRQAHGQFTAQRRQQVALEKQFRSIAQKAGMDPDTIAVDFLGELRTLTPGAARGSTSAPTTATPPSSPAPGTQSFTIGGKDITVGAPR